MILAQCRMSQEMLHRPGIVRMNGVAGPATPAAGHIAAASGDRSAGD